jgi:hypothetical protein
LGSSRNFRSHSILALPNSSISTQLSAPLMTAQIAMTLDAGILHGAEALVKAATRGICAHRDILLALERGWPG